MGPPNGDMFKGLSKEEHDARTSTRQPPSNQQRRLDQNTLVVNTGKQVVLFDTGTGAGTKCSARTAAA